MAQDLYTLFGVERPARASVIDIDGAPSGVAVRRMLAQSQAERSMARWVHKRLPRSIGRRDLRDFAVTFCVTFIGAMVFLV